MWKYITKDQYMEFILSFNLLENDWTDKKKIKCIYALSNSTEKHYRRFSIPKRNGGHREILEPDYLLKNIQKQILHNILENRKISKYATAYKVGMNIKNNALPHLKKKKILKLDISRFFDNISFKMVRDNAFPTAYFPPQVGILLTNLCCYYDYLPQGAPTSAYISNIVMKSFDDYIGKWCNDREISYTRYCDDMTFSGDFDCNKVRNKVRNILNRMGFELNESKCKIINSGRSQVITGIVTNKKLQVPKEYRKNIRQKVYFIKKYGIKSHLRKCNINNSEEVYLKSILGKINFILYINPNDKEYKIYKNIIKKCLKEQ